MSKVLGDDPFANEANPTAKKQPARRAAKAAKASSSPSPPPPSTNKTRAPKKRAAAPGKTPDAKEPPPPLAVPEPVSPIEVRAALAPAGQTETATSTALVSAQQGRPPEPPARRNRMMSPVSSRLRRLAMRWRSDTVDELGLDLLAQKRAEPLLDFLYSRYFRVETSGLDHIPSIGRALIVSNHSGFLPYDGTMLMHAVHRDHPAHRQIRPLIEDFVFHLPYLGTLMNRIGGVRACQENATRLLEQDQLVAVFPEGSKGTGKLYSERYQMQRFGRGGFVKLAFRTGAPIIPAAIVGAEEVQPMLGRIGWLARPLGLPYIPITPTFPWLGPLGLFPLPSKWRIAFGEPIYLDAAQEQAHRQEGAEDRILVNELTEQIRQKIQEMINDLLGRRRSVIFG